MRVGVISDTHAQTFDSIPYEIREALARVDLIIHAGDFTEKAVLDGLMTLAPVKAVCGNMDTLELRQLLPEQDVFEVNGKRVGLVHGSGGPRGIAERIREMFHDTDIIIYGHSHTPDQRIIRDSLLLNPGPAGESFCLLTIADEVKAEIIII